MSKTEILAELPRLSVGELAEVQAKLDELAGESWNDFADLSDGDKSLLDAAVLDFQQSPNSGDSWDDVKARVLNRIR